jgi:hypothetical protein
LEPAKKVRKALFFPGILYGLHFVMIYEKTIRQASISFTNSWNLPNPLWTSVCSLSQTIESLISL